ncbi:MAG TPA: ABC transporter permease [Candidatus Polarisedimenticolia bacterium]|nr:ABC transporter permease [Candidatus Polarisedimenticolia bacterium]
MPARIAAIALNTFREAIRNRVLYLLLVFAVAMISCAQVLSLMTVGSEEKIIKDFGLASIDIFGVLTSVFIGIGLVSREIERRTVYTLLAKPLHRFEFILGKYAGLVLTLFVNTSVMTLWFFLILALKGMFDLRLAIAVLLLFFQFLLITALAVLFSCLSTPILSGVLTLALYVVGHLLWSFDLLQAKLTSVTGRVACRALYYLLPNLGNFDVKGDVVHGLPVGAGTVGFAALYLAFYGAAVLLLACAVFQGRELQ